MVIWRSFIEGVVAAMQAGYEKGRYERCRASPLRSPTEDGLPSFSPEDFFRTPTTSSSWKNLKCLQGNMRKIYLIFLKFFQQWSLNNPFLSLLVDTVKAARVWSSLLFNLLFAFNLKTQTNNEHINSCSTINLSLVTGWCEYRCMAKAEKVAV